MNKILEERKKLINENIAAAEKEKAEAESLKKEYQQNIKMLLLVGQIKELDKDYMVEQRILK